MASYTFVPLQPEPGVQRDGTLVDTQKFTNAVWTRFYKNRPMKMGGYKVGLLGNSENITGLTTFDTTNAIYTYVQQPSTLSSFLIQNDLTTTAPYNRTPVDYIPNVENIWSVTSASYVVNDDQTPYVIAAAIPNGFDIANTERGQVYYGGLYSNEPLIPLVTTSSVNVETQGCLLVIGSFLLVLGNNGTYIWNDGETINNFPDGNKDTIGASKFVYAAPVRNQGVVSGLAWTLDGVVNISYTGTTFLATYVSTLSTILSSNCVVSYDPYFYWIGSNTFFMYNGAVVEVQNNTNKLWFFENLNQDYKQLVTGFVNKKFNEICWLAPMFGSTVNNWMIIYNMDTQEWYDTPLDRSCATSSTTLFPYPLMASSIPQTYNSTTSYPIWVHEYGVDSVDPVRTTAITSEFTTNVLWMVDQNPDAVVLMLDTLIPDVVQEGEMFFYVTAQGYPNSPVVQSDNFVFTNKTEFLTVQIKGSLLTLTFVSNVVGGNYLFGKTMVKLQITDDKRPGPAAT